MKQAACRSLSPTWYPLCASPFVILSLFSAVLIPPWGIRQCDVKLIVYTCTNNRVEVGALWKQRRQHNSRSRVKLQQSVKQRHGGPANSTDPGVTAHGLTACTDEWTCWQLLFFLLLFLSLKSSLTAASILEKTFFFQAPQRANVTVQR